MVDDASGNLVARWQAGDQQAARELFQRYTSRLIGLVRSRLTNQMGQRVDPEDVVQSAYRSFFAGASDGQFSFQKGGDLWKLLVVITLNKTHAQVRRNHQQKRAVELERLFGSEDSFVRLNPSLRLDDPSPLEAVTLFDQLEQLMRRLILVDRQILEMRLQGYNLNEIAAATGKSNRTVRRVLEEIKTLLEHQEHAEP